MEYKQSPTHRIVIALILVTVAVGGLFSVGIVGMVHIIEEHLVSRDLDGELERILYDNLARGRDSVLDPDIRFFISNGWGSYAMPSALDQLGVDFHEMFEGGPSFHTLMHDIDGRRFVLLQDQSGFEAHGQVPCVPVLTGYVLSIALAGLLDRILAHKVMEPVMRPAHQVRHHEQLLGLAPPLAPDYANNGIGKLATSFDETLGHLRGVLKHEQLFTNDANHELCIPLMVITTSCGLLTKEPNLGPYTRGQLERITKTTKEMRDLVQTLPSPVRVQEDEENPTPHSNLEDITDDPIQIWCEQVGARGPALHYHNEGAYAGQLNTPLLRAVIGNLLRNTTHYTDAGSTMLTLDKHGFSVKDTGVGVPEEQRERIFMPFAHSSSSSGRGEGLGLGSSLVKRIRTAKGWSIALSAMEPHGYRFEILFNVA